VASPRLISWPRRPTGGQCPVGTASLSCGGEAVPNR
jgi:hypothetical protein